MPGMSEERKKPGAVFQICMAAAVTISMLAGYIGTYAWIVTPADVYRENPSDPGDLIPTGYSVPCYLEDPRSAAENLLEAIFFPIHEIDRRVRSSVWGQRD
jgi:hypothetical protein